VFVPVYPANPLSPKCSVFCVLAAQAIRKGVKRVPRGGPWGSTVSGARARASPAECRVGPEARSGARSSAVPGRLCDRGRVRKRIRWSRMRIDGPPASACRGAWFRVLAPSLACFRLSSRPFSPRFLLPPPSFLLNPLSGTCMRRSRILPPPWAPATGAPLSEQKPSISAFRVVILGK